MAPHPRYKAAALAVALVALTGAARVEKVAGAILPEEAEKIGENRFRIARTYDEVLKFFRTVYSPGRYARRPITDTPSVKAVHIDNPDPKPGQWDGLNVYELKGETRIFVLVKPK